MGLFDKKICDICGEKIGLLEIENWMTEICVRIVRKNYHHGLRSGGIVR